MAKEQNALEVYASIDFDKDDVATIAVAEAEARIRRTINELSAQIKATDIKIHKNTVKIVDIGEKLVETKTAKKIATVKAGIAQTKIPKLSVTITAHVDSLIYNPERKSKPKINSYTISITKKSKDGERAIDSMIMEEMSFATTKEQLALAKSVYNLTESLTDLKKESVDWRKKLSDIPTLERQVRAKLAKDHLAKSKEGKALIEGLIKNFDETVKLLGM